MTTESQSPPGAPLVDVVDTVAEAQALATPPLLIREPLREFLGLEELPTVELVAAGHSNATFLIAVGESRMILRRPPRPPFAPSAHDVLREYRLLVALRDQPVRTPRPVSACEDPGVIGAPFYLMESLDGWVIRHELPEALDSEEQCAQIASEMIDTLVELHGVDPASVGLGDPARGERYLERQVELWAQQWQRNQRRAVPAIDEVTERLRAARPRTQAVTLVHGDYKLDNVLLAPRAPASILAILDWEMATLGDPLADLGFLTAIWTDRADAHDRAAGLSAVTRRPGFPSREELVARYGERSPVALDELWWYQTLALWKLAILFEASYGRYLAGTTDDEFFATLEWQVPEIAGQALALAGG